MKPIDMTLVGELTWPEGEVYLVYFGDQPGKLIYRDGKYLRHVGEETRYTPEFFKENLDPHPHAHGPIGIFSPGEFKLNIDGQAEAETVRKTHWSGRNFDSGAYTIGPYDADTGKYWHGGGWRPLNELESIFDFCGVARHTLDQYIELSSENRGKIPAIRIPNTDAFREDAFTYFVDGLIGPIFTLKGYALVYDGAMATYPPEKEKAIGYWCGKLNGDYVIGEYDDSEELYKFLFEDGVERWVDLEELEDIGIYDTREYTDCIWLKHETGIGGKVRAVAGQAYEGWLIEGFDRPVEDYEKCNYSVLSN